MDFNTPATLAALKSAIAAGGNPLEKAYTLQQNSNPTQGLQDYDLSQAVLSLYPLLTPLRNIIPRVNGGFGSQANWKAVTAIDTSQIFVGVSEGHRGSVVGLATAEYFAAYRTIGSEASITDEAVLAAADFDDVRARAANTGLQALMQSEEQVILGGNTSFNLGVTPTPALSTATTGGAIGSAVTVSVICVALTLDGLQRSSVANGVTGQATRTTADGYVETIGAGSARKSAANTIGTNGSSTANTVTASVTPVRGACGYAWYVGTAGAELIAAVTTVSTATFTALPGSGQPATALNAGVDSSTNSLIHDGLLTMAGNPNNGAIYQALSAGSTLTTDGSGGIVEFDNILQTYWDRLRLAPGSIWVNSQEALSIRRKILAAGPASISRFTFAATPGAITGGGALKGYINSFAMGNGPSEIPISVHPNMPPGTVLFLTHDLPYQANNVDNVLQIKTRKDYYQTEWPRRTRAYEYGVYSDQVLQCKFMPGLGMLTNITKG